MVPGQSKIKVVSMPKVEAYLKDVAKNEKGSFELPGRVTSRFRKLVCETVQSRRQAKETSEETIDLGALLPPSVVVSAELSQDDAGAEVLGYFIAHAMINNKNNYHEVNAVALVEVVVSALGEFKNGPENGTRET